MFERKKTPPTTLRTHSSMFVSLQMTRLVVVLVVVVGPPSISLSPLLLLVARRRPGVFFRKVVRFVVSLNPLDMFCFCSSFFPYGGVIPVGIGGVFGRQESLVLSRVRLRVRLRVFVVE